MGIFSVVTFGQRGWCALPLSGLLALGCALESADPSIGSGGTGSGAGVGGSAGGGAGAPVAGGAAGSAMAGGSGGAAAGTGGQAGSTAGGGAGAGAGGLAGVGGGSGAAGMSGSAGDGASGAGAGGMSGSAGGGGAAGGGAAGASAGASGSPNAGGAAGAAGKGGAGGSAGSAGSAGSGGSAGAASFQPCPATGACIVLPFGDSITDGFNVAGGYRMELFSRARNDMHEITYVGSLQNGPNTVDNVAFPRRHEGHSGWRINQLLDLTPSPAFATIPHLVLLMIGTNDAINNDNLSQAPARLGNLLDEIVTAAPNALVVVAKITPLQSNNDRVIAYNDALPAVLNQRISNGKHLLLVDQYTGFPMSELADGIHPNTAGYTRMAGVWYTAIEPYLR
jgi:lysophospholipase L1-like esterase